MIDTAMDGRLVRPVAIVGGVAVVAFLVLPAESLAQTIAATVPFVCAPLVLGLRVAASRGVVRRRLTPLLVAASLYSVGMGVWYLAAAAGRPIAFPSALDALFFAVFGIYGSFLVLVLRHRSATGKVESRLALLDSLVLTTTSCAVFWALLVAPSLPVDARPLTTAVALLYPGLSLAMLAVAVRLIASAGFLPSRPGILLVVWVFAEAVGDLIYGYQMVNGTFDYASAVTGCWIVAYAALSALGAHPDLVLLVADRPLGAPGTLAARWAPWGRSVRVLIALTPFVLALVDRDHAPVMVVAGSISFCLIMWRALLLSGDLRDQRRLTARLDEAVAELAARQAELETLAFTDALTGLANRARFTADLEQALGGDRAAAGARVAMLDLDDFKVVNDSLGHDAGDALLTAVAGRLASVVGPRGTVARLGGDEFAVILTGAAAAGGLRVAEEIVAALGRPFAIAGRVLHTAASVGVASATPGLSARALTRNADLAMYAAKAAGKGTISEFTASMLQRAQQRLALESHLWSAVERGELSVEYQPIVDLATGTTVSVEALVRWDHPTWGRVAPDQFIPAAESTGTIVGIGEWVLRQACAEAVILNARLGRPLSMAVNVSIRQAQEVTFARTVADALDASGLRADLLVLEVTESLVMDPSPALTATVSNLHALGVRLSIDDFGAGHSSLARLRSLPVSELKIDGGLVRQLPDDPACRSIVTAIIAMGRALGLDLVAEGVETPAQLGVLHELGCDMGQGFFFATPGPADDVHAVCATAAPHPAGAA